MGCRTTLGPGDSGRGGLQGPGGGAVPGFPGQDQDLRAYLGAPWGNHVGGRVQAQGVAASLEHPHTPGGAQSRLTNDSRLCKEPDAWTQGLREGGRHQGKTVWAGTRADARRGAPCRPLRPGG